MDCKTEDKIHKPLKLHYLFWTIISALVPCNLQGRSTRGEGCRKILQERANTMKKKS